MRPGVVHLCLAERIEDRFAQRVGNGVALVDDLDHQPRWVRGETRANQYLGARLAEFEGIVQQLSEHQLHALAIDRRAACLGAGVQSYRSTRGPAGHERWKSERIAAL